MDRNRVLFTTTTTTKKKVKNNFFLKKVSFLKKGTKVSFSSKKWIKFISFKKKGSDFFSFLKDRNEALLTEKKIKTFLLSSPNTFLVQPSSEKRITFFSFAKWKEYFSSIF